VLVCRYKSVTDKSLGKKRKIGSFIVDLTYLKGTSRVKEISATPAGKGDDHYAVEYVIKLEVMQKNLYWHAHFKNDATVLPGSQGQGSIATSFEPGTD
jgi:hypothetical protein